MSYARKKSVLGILIDAIDYEGAVNLIIQAACEKRGFAVSALAVHGVMTGVLDREHQFRLNHFDLVVPDGQPVRWALNWIHRTKLRDRICGPMLMLAVCSRAEQERIPVYFYGSTVQILDKLMGNLRMVFPGLHVAGVEPSQFRQLSPEERNKVVLRIRESGARIVFVGLGCPRQEVWAYELRDALSLPILTVGAAFPFHAGLLPRAPEWMQKFGLEWLFRLGMEPHRLWRRYLLLNPAYLSLLGLQAAGLWKFHADGRQPPVDLRYG